MKQQLWIDSVERDVLLETLSFFRSQLLRADKLVSGEVAHAAASRITVHRLDELVARIIARDNKFKALPSVKPLLGTSPDRVIERQQVGHQHEE